MRTPSALVAVLIALQSPLAGAADAWLFAAAPDHPNVAAPEAAAAAYQADPFVVPTSERSIGAWQTQAGWLANRLARRGLRLGDRVHLRLFKRSRELDVYLERGDRFVRYRTFPICSISGTLGPKRFEGDLQAPEGFYSVRPERFHPNSEFHLAFNLGYPNEHDRALGRTGSNIMIHGGCASTGCFAISDYYMEQLWVLAEAAVRAGQPAIGVEIYPFRMTEQNLRAHEGRRWIEFWRGLKPVHDHFATTGRPAPIVAGAPGDDVDARSEPALGRSSAP
jgi:murein L,D-transpeptidase YafK